MSKIEMTLGSLFDGSGGFPLAGLLCGITPVWASEIEPFPIRVTTKRLSFMKHYGDVSAMDGAEIEPVDIITFGSPCQDMSVAGKRAGLDGERSNLFYQAIRIVKEMRCATNGKYPRYIVWENVPGAFSSNKGEDFRCVLESVCRVVDETASIPATDRWTNAGEIMGENYSVCWRVLDAQYWGVPQRRKRIFLVADFAGGSASKVLFESEGLSGYSAEGFRTWQTAARNPEACVRTASAGELVLNDQGGSRMDVTFDHSLTLRAEAHHPPVVMESSEYKSAGFCMEESAKTRSIGYEEETSPTLRAGKVPAAMMFENHSHDTRFTGPIDTSQTISALFGTGGNNQPFVVEKPKTLKIRSGCDGGGKGALIQEDKSATLSTVNDQTVFVPTVFGICAKNSNSMKSDNPNSGIYEADTSRALDGNGGNPSCNQGGMAVVEGNGSRPSHFGNGYKESEIMYSLNTVDRHAVAYGIDRAAFNQGQNALYNFAVEEEVEPTMLAKGPGAVAHSVIASSKASFFTRTSNDKTETLVATDYKDPPIVTDKTKINPHGFHPQMKSECATMTEDKSTTLVNGTNPGYQNGVVDADYIVRRLTPTECARLQGFPDWWCSALETEEPTMDDLKRWYDIFETHRNVIGKSAKPKSLKQISKWLKNPYSDSAEYKMWGNGVALPCVAFVLAGIVYFSGE